MYALSVTAKSAPSSASRWAGSSANPHHDRGRGDDDQAPPGHQFEEALEVGDVKPHAENLPEWVPHKGMTSKDQIRERAKCAHSQLDQGAKFEPFYAPLHALIV